MKKKIMILFLFVFIFVFSIGKVSAAVECEYQGKDESGNDFWANFTLTGKPNSNPKVNYSHDSGSWDYITNWDYALKDGSDSNGLAYNYNLKCPEKVVYIHFYQCYMWCLWTGSRGQNIYIAKDDKEVTSILDRYKTGDHWAEYWATGNLIKQNEVPEDVIEEPLSCKEFTNSKKDCEVNPYFSCMWVEGDGYSYCNVNDLQYIRCGDAFDIPKEVPPITSFLINFLKILTPLILIVISMIDLIKAIASSKEDEMKKVQQTLIKRIAAAALVFFVIAIVQFVIKKVANNSKEETSISDCLSCFINGDCNDSKYYKTNIKGTNICTTVVGQNEIECKDNN